MYDASRLTYALERPCRNCALANRPCTYAVRDREVTISKTYLERLERGLARLDTPATASSSTRQLSGNSPQEVTISAPSSRQAFDPVAENPDADVFVSRLKEIQFSHLSPGALQANSETYARSDHSDISLTSPPRYEYFGLNFDTPLDSAESKNRTLMCQLLVVLALAESVDASRELEINQGVDVDTIENGLPTTATTATAAISPPGKEFFEQALDLFNVPYEDASVEHIEVLNMFVG
ncbi:hypothetical protein ACHAPJ_009624 [Fusarium lateritium]